MSSRKRVICTCISHGCSKETHFDRKLRKWNGRPVAPSTRWEHEQDDAALSTDKDDTLASAQSMPLHESNTIALPAGPNNANRTWIDELMHELQNRRPNPSLLESAIYLLSYLLISSLHLVFGLSRAGCDQALKIIDIVVHLTLELGRTSSRTEVHVLQETRNAMRKLNIEPQITRTVCCPECFENYPLNNIPEICGKRQTIQSNMCGKSLWTTVYTRRGPKRVPRRLYSTQDFYSWLQYFLGRPGIEDLIDQSYQHIPDPTNMRCIWDSPAWNRGFENFSTSDMHNLTFAFYIDWFNPFSNKIAGKTVSCGAIMFFCLNLPHDVRYHPENTYFAGITPPPKEPTVETINELLNPVLDQFVSMWYGKEIQTYRFPEGTFKHIGILAGIGDLPAIRKAFGFAGVGSKNHFCTFCKLTKAGIDNLAIASWQFRDGDEVKAAAEASHLASTLSRRKEILDTYGVRWSAFHRLTYRNPVLHTVLGIMHNWLEGVLQHHVRHKWRLGVPAGTTSSQITVQKTPAKTARTENDSDHTTDSEYNYSDTSSAAREKYLSVNDIEKDLSGNDTEDERRIRSNTLPCIFSKAELVLIHRCLSEAFIPSWIERPPTNLGEASHGKLKADQWFTLITIFLPMILPEIWMNGRPDLLENFTDLVQCTNFVCAYRTSTALADLYTQCYIRYRQSSAILFPHVHSRPNHHYAMHIGDLLKWWGPLITLSEFQGEQHNGKLQKVKTNSNMRSIDYTMLHQVCQQGRFRSLISQYCPDILPSEMSSEISPFGLVQKAFGVFKSGSGSKSKTPKRNCLIDPEDYDQLVQYINIRSIIKVRHHMDCPHPLNANVLSPWANSLDRITHNHRVYSTKSAHPGNSSISFTSGHNTMSGFIDKILSMEVSGNEEIFIILSLPNILNAADALKSPYTQRPGLVAALVYNSFSPLHQVIALSQIEGHVAFYPRPAGTFGILSETLVIINSLHRERV